MRHRRRNRDISGNTAVYTLDAVIRTASDKHLVLRRSPYSEVCSAVTVIIRHHRNILFLITEGIFDNFAAG